MNIDFLYRYTREAYLDLVSNIRTIIPGIFYIECFGITMVLVRVKMERV